MKKLTAFIVMMLLCISAFGMTVSAEGEPAITVSSATAAQGDEVVITVDIANNPGIAMLELPISYDTSRLEKAEFVAGGLPGGYVNTTGVWITTGDSTYNGTILTLKFKVLDNAPVGEAAVSVSVKSAANWNEQSVSFDVTNGAVTVTEPFHEHVYGQWIVEKAATCTVNGSKYRTCTVAGCHEKQTEVITASGHSLGDWAVVTAATCTKEGTEARKCANCDYAETRPIPMKDHNFGDWKIVKEAACDQEGFRSRTCADCDYTETESVGALNHTYDTLKYDADHHWYSCQCGDSTAPEAHDFENSGVCACGYRKPVTTEPTLDDVPKTGDITYVVAAVPLAVAAVIMFAVTAVILACKRRNAR